MIKLPFKTRPAAGEPSGPAAEPPKDNERMMAPGVAEEHYANTLKSSYMRELFEQSTGLHAKRA